MVPAGEKAHTRWPSVRSGEHVLNGADTAGTNHGEFDSERYVPGRHGCGAIQRAGASADVARRSRDTFAVPPSPADAGLPSRPSRRTGRFRGVGESALAG